MLFDVAGWMIAHPYAGIPLVILGWGLFVLIKPYRTCRWCKKGTLAGEAGQEAARPPPLFPLQGPQADPAPRRVSRPQGQAVADPGMGREGVGLMAACSGLHCSGCAAGGGAPVLVFGAVYGFVWVAEHIIEVVAVSATCGILAVAAVIALMQWADRRDARRAAAWHALSAREVPAVDRSHIVTSVPSAERPALGFRDLHIHLDGVPSAEQAAVIRQALNGRTSQS